MKKIFLLSIFLIGGMFLVNNTNAMVQAVDNDGGSQTKAQVKTVNQGEEVQAQVQTRTQIQNTEVEGIQNQERNQGEDLQLQNREQEQVQKQDESGDPIMQQKRSQVANAVQEMLQVADRVGGIGQQVRVIAQAQNQNQEKIETSLEKVKTRNRFVKFLIGPDYTEVSKAVKVLEQNREQVNELKQIKEQVENMEDGQILENQAEILEKVNLELEKEISESQKGFSLFGWVARLFNK
jgi:hypothetical protein